MSLATVQQRELKIWQLVNVTAGPVIMMMAHINSVFDAIIAVKLVQQPEHVSHVMLVHYVLSLQLVYVLL